MSDHVDSPLYSGIPTVTKSENPIPPAFNSPFYSPPTGTKPNSASNIAKAIHDDGRAYSVYGAVDAGVLGLSLLKFAFKDVLYSTESSSAGTAALQDWMLSPAGIISSVALIVPLSVVSAVANHFSTSNTAAGKLLYRNWQMGRDGIKGLRNTYRGVDNALTTASLLSSQDLRYILLPTGLFLGVLSLGNRVGNRHFIINPRKDLKDKNAALIKAMDNWGTLRKLDKKPTSKALDTYKNSYYIDTSESSLYYVNHKGKSEAVPITTELRKNILKELGDKKAIRPNILDWYYMLPDQAPKHYLNFLEHIRTQAAKGDFLDSLKQKAYISAAAGGFFDGLYMFMGIVALSALAPYALILVATVSLCFSALCIFTRLHEEKAFQLDLSITQQKAELALVAKEVDYCIAKYRGIKASLDAHAADDTTKAAEELRQSLKIADDALHTTFAKLNLARTKLHDTAKLTTADTILIGLRHGVSAYIALLASVFAASVISVLFFATPLPQIVVLFTVAAGVAMLAAFTFHAFCCTRAYEAKQGDEAHTKNKSLENYIDEQKGKPAEALFEGLPEVDPNAEANGNSIYEMALGASLPVWHLMNWADVIRSFFSGLMKGPKCIDFVSNLFEGTDHHDVGNPLLGVALVFSAIVCAAVYAFRGLAKYRSELDEPHPFYQDPEAWNEKISSRGKKRKRPDLTLHDKDADKDEVAQESDLDQLEDPASLAQINIDEHNDPVLEETSSFMPLTRKHSLQPGEIPANMQAHMKALLEARGNREAYLKLFKRPVEEINIQVPKEDEVAASFKPPLSKEESIRSLRNFHNEGLHGGPRRFFSAPTPDPFGQPVVQDSRPWSCTFLPDGTFGTSEPAQAPLEAGAVSTPQAV